MIELASNVAEGSSNGVGGIFLVAAICYFLFRKRS